MPRVALPPRVDVAYRCSVLGRTTPEYEVIITGGTMEAAGSVLEAHGAAPDVGVAATHGPCRPERSNGSERSAWALAALAIGTQACPSPEKAQAPTRIPRTAPRRSRPLKPADAKALVAAYEAGKSMKDLAAEFGINRVTVSNHLRRAKVAIRQVGLAPEQMAEVVHLYQIGWSSGRLADHVDVSADTVLRTLRRAGVVVRPRRGGPRPKAPSP